MVSRLFLGRGGFLHSRLPLSGGGGFSRLVVGLGQAGRISTRIEPPREGVPDGGAHSGDGNEERVDKYFKLSWFVFGANFLFMSSYYCMRRGEWDREEAELEAIVQGQEQKIKSLKVSQNHYSYSFQFSI